MKIRKGQWYSFCCHEDLCEAYEDEYFGRVYVFNSELKGLEFFLRIWKGSHSEENDCSTEIKECEERIAKLI